MHFLLKKKENILVKQVKENHPRETNDHKSRRADRSPRTASEQQPGCEALYTGAKGWRALGGRIHSKDEPYAEDPDEWEATTKAWHVRTGKGWRMKARHDLCMKHLASISATSGQELRPRMKLGLSSVESQRTNKLVLSEAYIFFTLHTE